MKTDELICKNAAIGYDGVPVAQNISFKLSRGDYLCILGENGSGKSTLVKTLLGLQNILDGQIEWCGDAKPSDIGYLPQQTAAQRDFPASVREIVLSGCLAKCGMRPFYNKAEKELAAANMKMLGVEHLAKRCYRELSGGQQQRVLLARALCAADKILLLDEPVTGLDPKAAADMYDVVKKLNDDGITIIMISHNTETAVKHASHILHMGDKMFFGTTAEYLDSAQGKAFLSLKGGGANA